ncbi:MAG: hypothetical protein ACM3Q2_17755 [Syntrophothermus sp.]
MKKGCFLGILVFITITIGIVSYVVKNKPEMVTGVVRPWMVDRINDEFKKSIDKISESPEKDSLNAVVGRYISFIKNEEGIDFDKDKGFFEEFHFAVRDSVIDSAEIAQLKKIFTKHVALINERHKKNTD